MRLTGIIDFTMDNFLCIRGFAPMLELSEISKADEKIQRDLIEDHKGDMEAFLSDGKFTFFPEVILGTNMKGLDSDIDKINLVLVRKWISSSSESVLLLSTYRNAESIIRRLTETVLAETGTS